MSAVTTRRALLGGAGLATAAMVAPAVAATRRSPAISLDLAALIAAAAHAERANRNYHENVYEPAKAEFERQYATIPHVAVSVDDKASGYWTTANSGAVRIAGDVVASCPSHPDLTQLRKLVAADLLRQRAVKRIRRATGLTAALKHSDVLCDAATGAQDAVSNFKCGTIGDLHAKLAFMVERDLGNGIDRLDDVLADVARIAKWEGR